MLVNEDVQEILPWKFIECYSNSFRCAAFKVIWRTNLKTKRLDLHMIVTMRSLYMNWNIEDCLL